MSVTDEIKSRIDIVSYIQRYVPDLKKAGRNHKACCPFHTEKTPSFVVNPARQTWRCFGACAEGGDIFSFAQKLHGWDFKEALRELASEAGLQLRQQSAEEKNRTERLEHLRGIAASAAELFQRELYRPAGASTQAYLREQRGLAAETVRRFQLGYAPRSWDFMLKFLRELGHNDEDIIEVGLAVRNEQGKIYDRFRHRLIFPIHDDRGRTVGFGGRALDANDSAKYINSPQSAIFDKSRLLYGLDKGKGSIRERGLAVIVEGYMDVIQAHQAGYANVIAQMGTAMTEAQLRLVAPRFASRVLLALDADAAGQNAARRSLEVAREALAKDYAGKLAVDIGVLSIPAGQDPDDFLREKPDGWEALVEGAQGVADFVIAMETADLPADAGLQARQTLAKTIFPILQASENNVYRQENIQKLARRLRVGERDMLAWMQAANNATRPRKPATRPSHPDSAIPPPYWDEEAFEETPQDFDPSLAEERELPEGYAAKTVNRAAEAYCLSALLKNPNMFFLVNRKLRELAGEDEAMLSGPLRELGADDFTQSQYRALMSHFQAALTQDDQEPLEYLGDAVEDDLRADYLALLLDEPEKMSRRIRGNFQVDLNDIVKRGLRGAGARMNSEDELVCRALQLRLERLENERIELQYLQEEAQALGSGDDAQSERINQNIMLSMRAKARINRAVS